MDQVPPPLVIFLDYTWDKKDSHGPVCFSHTGTGSGGGKFNIKLYFRQRGIQPNIAVIFRLTGGSIEKFDK